MMYKVYMLLPLILILALVRECMEIETRLLYNLLEPVKDILVYKEH